MNNNVEKQVRQSLVDDMPDIDFNYILQECEKIDMEKSKTPKKSFFPKISIALATVCIALFAFISINFMNDQNSHLVTVAFDVNPSITMDVSKKGTVISVVANNDDAKNIIDGLDLNGTDANIATTKIVEAMKSNGYITDLENTILFTVEGNTQLSPTQQNVVDGIKNTLTSSTTNSAILYQEVNNTSALQELANKYNISVGKAQYINDLIAADNTLTFEQLAPLPLHDLSLLTVNGNRNVEEQISQSGSVNTTKYLSKDVALQKALDGAGVPVQDVIESDVDFDVKNGIFLYEIEIETSTGEYEIDIDATSGAIISSNYEPENNSHPSSSNNLDDLDDNDDDDLDDINDNDDDDDDLDDNDDDDDDFDDNDDDDDDDLDD